MGQLKQYQEQVQEAVEKGIASVEEAHKSIIVKPFEFAEKLESEAKSYSVQSVRDMHDEAVANFYSSVRSLNQKVADYAGDFLTRIEGEVEPAKKPAKKAPAKKAPAKKPAAKAAAAA